MTEKISAAFARIGVAQMDTPDEARIRAQAHDGETDKIIRDLGGPKRVAALTSGKLTEEKVSAFKNNTSDGWMLLGYLGGVQKAAQSVVPVPVSAPEERKSSPRALGSSPANPAP